MLVVRCVARTTSGERERRFLRGSRLQTVYNGKCTPVQQHPRTRRVCTGKQAGSHDTAEIWSGVGGNGKDQGNPVRRQTLDSGHIVCVALQDPAKTTLKCLHPPSSLPCLPPTTFSNKVQMTRSGCGFPSDRGAYACILACFGDAWVGG